MPSFETLEDIVVAAAEGARPPERLSVSEAAVKYRKLNNVGSYVGPWTNDMTPYLTEPMDLLSSTAYQAMIFVGPAQCGKTEIFLNWQTHSVVCDPADMMLIQTSQTTARDFSKRRIDRLHRHSRDVGERLITGRNDNIFDKKYTSGMLLTLSWPAINELSGKPIPRLFLTDYDRMPQDIDGEGNPFDLARKRATSFKRFGMTVAESSPGFEVTNPRWMPSTRHEAPPTEGVLALFNRGDRRRFYWRCINVECQNAFEPDFNLLDYPSTKDQMDAAEQAVLVCPHCGQIYSHGPSEDGLQGPGKHAMNRAGRWVRDGQIWTPDGEFTGKPIRSDIASFWLKGVAAAFSDWKTLVLNYLKAEEEYEKTGSQESLKTTVNVDQGNPYVRKGADSGRLPEELRSTAKDYGQRVVPHGVRFLVATVDVQKNRFVVQVHGFSYGGDIYIVDRFEIYVSKRPDPNAAGQFAYVNPGAYLEDWKLLLSEVMAKSYELSDGSGRRMSVKLTLCDSGGREGVTTNAYNFWRWLRDGDPVGSDDPHPNWEPNLHNRFQLLKGATAKGAPRVQIGYPDSQRSDRHAGALGEIPVLFINPNLLKDALDNKLARTDPKGGRINFPNWLPDTFFTELTVEIRTPKGWENPRNFRNESWDLLVYALAGSLTVKINIERPGFWEDPPTWAEDWALNDLVFDPVVKNKAFGASVKPEYDLAKLADQLG